MLPPSLVKAIFRYARLKELRNSGASWPTPKSRNIAGASLKLRATGSSSSLQALWTRCVVPRAMAEQNADLPSDGRIEFRMGINLGDVMVEEHDIFGDGVNVAARLEALAEPDGIYVSRMVRDNVRDKLEFDFEDPGEHQFKNIARAVRVYRVRDRAIVAEKPTPASHQPPPLPDKALDRSPSLRQYEW